MVMLQPSPYNLSDGITNMRTERTGNILILRKPHQSRIVNLQIFSGTIAPIGKTYNWFKFAQTPIFTLHWMLRIVDNLQLRS